MFIQVIDFRTDQIEQSRKYVDEYRAATEGRRTARRGILAEDRDNPGRYLSIVFFDSYEEAMKNSAMPETQQLSESLMGLSEGPPTFINLEVVSDDS